MSDLTQLSNSVLIEDLEKLRRYRESMVRNLGRRGYAQRWDSLMRECQRRDLSVPFTPSPTQDLPPCRLKPLADHLVVLPEHEEDISKGGIIIPETAKAKPMQGEILAVGPGRYEPNVGTLPMMVKVGDVVLFGRYAGVEVVLDEQRVLILREEDLLGVLPPKDSE